MKSINDLAIWDKDALMAWVFDMEEQIFNMKRKRTEDLFMDIPQQKQQESREPANRDAAQGGD